MKRVKFFVSHGQQDTFVPKKQSLEQTEAIRETGLENVRHEIHAGRGWMNPDALGTALGWFAEEK
jgi:predicted esterase